MAKRKCEETPTVVRGSRFLEIHAIDDGINEQLLAECVQDSGAPLVDRFEVNKFPIAEQGRRWYWR